MKQRGTDEIGVYEQRKIREQLEIRKWTKIWKYAIGKEEIGKTIGKGKREQSD